MNSQINLMAIIIANLMGFTLLFTLLVAGKWRFNTKSYENRSLKLLIGTSLISCVIDPLTFLADSRPGILCYLVVLLGNTWMFFANTIIGPGWLFFMANHLGVRVSRKHRRIIQVLAMIGIVILVVNFFVPIVFSVGEDNLYSREKLFWLYLVLDMGFFADSFVLYIHSRRRSGMLKFFPVWAFAIPVLIGVTTQMVMYGVSTIWPFIAVSISCVFMCLQNEVMYRDKLTGLYNRFYLNILEGELKGRSSNEYSAIMIDVNRFKEINDTYGHLTGDDALIDVANILRQVVSDLGEVTRYAGDEFIVIVNSQDAAVMDDLLDRINKAMETFNATKGKPYRLSVSMGYEKMDLNKHTMGEVLDATDVRMYENKREFYRTHPGLNRRR